MKHKRLSLITALAVIVMIVVAIGLRAHAAKTDGTKPSQQYAQSIPQSTFFAKVRELSVGKKPACLTRDIALDQTVQADDKLPFEKSMSTALGTVIPDMPAGYTTIYLHNYTPTSAIGYEIFSDKSQQTFAGSLKSFNFSIQRSSTDATWKLASFIACSE
ncbi:MAG: hypothetical protein ABI602_00565 [Candidatus Saccharibacteria bacterium]